MGPHAKRNFSYTLNCLGRLRESFIKYGTLLSRSVAQSSGVGYNKTFGDWRASMKDENVSNFCFTRSSACPSPPFIPNFGGQKLTSRLRNEELQLSKVPKSPRKQQ